MGTTDALPSGFLGPLWPWRASGSGREDVRAMNADEQERGRGCGRHCSCDGRRSAANVRPSSGLRARFGS